MSIRLITFDLDDTLWDVTPVMQQAEHTLRLWLRQHATRLGKVSAEDFALIRNVLLNQEPLLRYRLSELRRRILLVALQDAGYTQIQAVELAEQAFQVFLEARHQVELFPGTLNALKRLSQDYSLAVITNGNAEVSRLGLGEYFAFALNAEALGLGKPHPLPFTTALQCANLRPEQVVHIGDQPIDDIAGAQAVGMRTVWFNRQQLPWQHEHKPDAEIHTLEQLPALLEQWR